MAEKRRLQSSHATGRARRLRRNATFPERLLWSHLRSGRLAGLKFRRQFPLEPFILDFYCHEALLAIELDGASHDGRAAEDQRRTQYLVGRGIRVLRVSNDDVLQDIEAILMGILKACGRDSVTGVKQSFPHPSPLPEGEGEGR